MRGYSDFEQNGDTLVSTANQQKALTMTLSFKHTFTLTTSELMLLDGKCSDEIQQRINQIKSGEITEPQRLQVGYRIYDTSHNEWPHEPKRDQAKYRKRPEAYGLATVIAVGDFRHFMDEEGVRGTDNSAAIVYDVDPGNPYMIDAVIPQEQFVLASDAGLEDVLATDAIRKSFDQAIKLIEASEPGRES